MTKDEYYKAKEELIAKHGQPEFDYDQTALNESARMVKALQQAYRLECAAAKRKEAAAKGQKQEDNSLEGIAKEGKRQAYQGLSLPPIYLDEADLKKFTEEEKLLLRDRFLEPTLSYQQLAVRHQIPYQKITSLMNSIDVQHLIYKTWAHLMSFETFISLMRLLKTGNERLVLRCAEQLKMLQTEKLELQNIISPLQDTKAQALLKELGDKLAKEE